MSAQILRCSVALTLMTALWLAFGQSGGGAPRPPGDIQLPNGKSQRAEILKAERLQNIKDAADPMMLPGAVKESICGGALVTVTVVEAVGPTLPRASKARA